MGQLLKEIETFYKNSGAVMTRDELVYQIAQQESVVTVERAKLNGLKKALASKNTERTKNYKEK